MNYVELVGWIAAALTLSAWYMRTMLPLRSVAVLANICFASYGALAEIYPTLVLHLALLPLNSFRLYQLISTTQKIQGAKTGNEAIEMLKPLMTPTHFSDGSYVFRKGDTPDNLYFLDSGKIHLEETDIWLSEGEIFGEMAFFSDAGERTMSAKCDGSCQILMIDETTLMRLYYQHPPLAFYLIKLVTRRLLEGMEKHPGVYLPRNPAINKDSPNGAEHSANRSDVY